MTYPLLKFFHLLGLTLMGAGLIGVWFADLRSRQVRQLPIFQQPKAEGEGWVRMASPGQGTCTASDRGRAVRQRTLAKATREPRAAMC